LSLAPRVRAALFAIEVRQNMTLATDSSLAAKTSRATLTIQVEALLSRLYPAVECDRRQEDRAAISVLFRLTPFDANHQLLVQEASIVVGKNISRRGVSFYHEKAITHRRALIELADPAAGIFVVEIDVTWCRFTKPGWYESGGRLIRSAAPTADLSTTDEPPVAVGIPQLSFPASSDQAATNA
jgi:hypothetical protein